MEKFLPDNYELPNANQNYMKFEKGENRFRILSKAIAGWLDWQDKKPHRFPIDKKPAKPFDPNKPIKHFWAFVVWNYNHQCIQILEITQAGIQKSISDISKDEEWGSPFEYDLKVNRKGEGLETEYSITPSPKKNLSEEVKKAALDKPCYLEALYAGEDPWTVNDKQTDLAFMDLPF